MIKHAFKGTADDNGWNIESMEAFKQACKNMTAKHGGFTLLVCDSEAALSEAQKNWYKMTVRKISEHTGECQHEVNRKIKAYCGFGLLDGSICEIDSKTGESWFRRMSYKDLSNEEMSILIDNMIAWGQRANLPIFPPNREKWKKL